MNRLPYEIRNLANLMESLVGEMPVDDENVFSREKIGTMHCDVAEMDGKVVVTADLPGYSKDHINVRCDEKKLTISANMDAETEENEGSYMRRERVRGSHSREIRLRSPVDCDNVEATFNNGVLEVTLPIQNNNKDTVDVDID